MPELAPVAQLDRALDYESRGQEFESLRARQITSIKCRRYRHEPADGDEAFSKVLGRRAALPGEIGMRLNEVVPQQVEEALAHFVGPARDEAAMQSQYHSPQYHLDLDCIIALAGCERLSRGRPEFRATG